MITILSNEDKVFCLIDQQFNVGKRKWLIKLWTLKMLAPLRTIF